MTLNTKLFDNNKLKPEIRSHLLVVADEFCKFIKESGIDIIPADIRLVGSNAGYDYKSDSDVDLHIVVDFDSVCCNKEILQSSFNSLKRNFNDKYDASVKGIPIELYVEDVKAGTQSNGIYSIKYNKWIKFPTPERPISKELTNKWQHNVNDWIVIIDKVSVKNNLEIVQNVLNRIYMMRKNGLETGGIKSAGNYIFKQLRSLGYLDKLRNRRDELLSDKLTLESKITEEE